MLELAAKEDNVRQASREQPVHAARLPEAPITFSTMTGTPHSSESFSAITPYRNIRWSSGAEADRNPDWARWIDGLCVGLGYQ